MKEDIRDRIRRLSEVAPNGCWNWTGSIDRRGYSKTSIGARFLLGHRASYEAFVGPIPDGLQIDHLCRNTKCVNPDHLEVVTQDENMRRRYADYTHCVNGHRYTQANTYVRPNGTRDCRVCIRERVRKYALRKKAAVA